MSEERKSRYELFLEEQEKPKKKRCKKCGEVKLLSAFYKDGSGAYGVRGDCKECVKARAWTRKYRDSNDRFWKFYWSHVVKVNNCLEWTGWYHGGKLPYATLNKKDANVRRIVYKLAIGDVPNDMFVVAKCRNTRCVRHAHLKLVSGEELEALKCNSAASGERNGMRRHPERRSSVGNKNLRPNIKLADDQVREIRLLRNNGWTLDAIAAHFGVCRTNVRLIVSGKTWAHVQ